MHLVNYAVVVGVFLRGCGDDRRLIHVI